MKKEIFASVSSLLFPLGLYGVPTSANGSYVRSYLRASNRASQPFFRSRASVYSHIASETLEDSFQLGLVTNQRVDELVVIDAAVPEKYVFYQQVKPGVEIVELKSDQDGAQQLEKILSNYSNLSAVHIVSHAEQGSVQLGSSWLTTDSIKNQVELFSAVNNAVKNGGDLLFYGCELADGPAGDEFLELIANNTHIDIAASNNLTGTIAKDGDWVLEIHKGDIEAELPFSAHALKNFSSVLAINDGTGKTITTSGFPSGYSNTKSYDVDSSGYVLRLSTSSVGSSAIYCDFGYCAMNFGGGLSDIEQLYIEFVGGGSFDIDSMQVYSPAGNNTYVFTPSSGSPVNSSAIDTSGPGFSTIPLSFTNITKLTITRQDNGDLNGFDINDLIIKNAAPSNASPVISIDNAALAYTEGDAATQIDSAGTVSDADGDADWNGGTLEVQTTLNAEGTDTTSISDTDGDGTAITVSGTNIFANAVDIGDLSASGGTVTGATKLTITFDSDATNANVQEVLQSIRFVSSSENPGTSRTVTFTATDTNAASNSDTRTISITRVNDEPTLTATASNPTFTEGGAAASLYSSASASTIEGGQDISGLTFTVTNVNDGSNERINVDGTTIVLTHGTSGTTASNSLSYSVSVIGSTATVSLTGGTMSTAATQTMINAMSYQNNSNSPSTSNRVVTLTSIQDSGGTANGGDNTGSLAIASTVTVVQNNDEPTLTATGSNPTFTEGGAAASLFSGSSASTIESGQTIKAMTLTVTNVNDGINERLNLDGSVIFLTHGTSGTTATNSLSFSVIVVGTTATVSLSGGTMSTAATQTLIDAMSYQNTSNTPNTSNRVVTITSLQDSGGTANGGDDTAALAIASTVTVVGVNDEPTLTATGSNPTFTEGGAAASLYSSASASTIESGQTISALTMTVTNVNDGSNERLNVDGTTIVLTHGTSGTTASNSLSYSVSVIGSTATLSLSGGTLSTAATQTMVNAMSYQNNSNTPNTSNRVVTITSMQDSGGTANGGDNTASLAIASTVTVVGNNDEPTLTATGSNPTFTEGGAAASLFSGSSVGTVESGQTIKALTLTVTNVNDGINERLNVDGSIIFLTHGTSGTTASNSLSYSVSVVGTTATVSLSGGTMSTAATQTLIDAMSYQNTSNTPNTSNRVVTITSLQDSGGTANGGDDTAALAVASTVTIVGVNDEPTLTATGSDPTFTEGGAAASLYSGASASTIESGQTIAALTLTVTNVNDGSNERLNVDGTTIVLTHGTSGTTASNSLSYSVSVIGSTATLSLSGGTLSTAATQTMVNAMSYQNNSNTPNTSNRVVTITSMQDSGGTANGGDNTASLAIASTVTVVGNNDEPTLTATGSNPTFTEGGAAASLFSGSSVGTIESGQTLSALTLTVTNVNNGSNELLNADGSAIVLTHGTSGTTTTNSLSYSVSVSGSTATVTLSGGTLSTAATQTLVNALSYQNNSQDPNTSNRVVTITSLQDSGGTANGGDDTAALAVASTVTIVGVNDEPTLTATGSNPTFTEGGAAVSLYSSTSASTIESGQTIAALTLTVTNVNDGSNERLNVDGSTIVLTDGTSGTTATNSLSYSVSVVGSTATVSLTGGTMSTAATQTLVDAISYQNNSGSLTVGNRVVTLTSVQDSGGTANGGDNTTALSIASTVSVVNANNEPTLSATGSDPTFTEGGAAVGLFSGSSVGTVESGQTILALTLEITNVNDGSNEILNADGSAIALTNSNSGTTTDNSLTYNISVSGTTATVSITMGGFSTANTQTLVDNLTYQNNSQTPTTNNRVVTITALQDNGGTANGGDDTAALAVASTVTVVSVNDEPILSATGDNPAFVENGAAVNPYSGTSVSTVESGQTLIMLTLTVTNVNDGSDEVLNIDGSAIALTDSNSGTTTDNSLSYNVSVTGSTATLTLSGGTLSAAAMQTLVDELSYQNNNDMPDTSDRVITLTGLQDSGGTANGGDDTSVLSVVSTISVTAASDTDTDGDGVSDYQEGLDGTDPNDPEDYLDTTAPVLSAPNDLVIDASGLYTRVTLRQLLGLSSSASASALTAALNTIASDNIDGDVCCDPSVQGMSNNYLLLPPGRNTITWRAVDNKNNAGQATQIVNIRPLVSMSKDQIGVEGTSVQFRIILNGASPFYPLQIPFVINSNSTANSSDHDLVAGSVSFAEGQRSTSITVNLTQDNVAENDETLLVNLDDRTTAAQDLADGYDENSPNIYDINSGAKTQHILTITEGNVPPKTTLQLQQNSINTIQVTPGGGAVTVTAVVVDPNPGDTHQFDWTASDARLSDTDNNLVNAVFVFNPTDLTAGVYKLQVRVSDAAMAVDTKRLYFRVVDALPALSDSDDADGDGAGDFTEGTADSDGDGIPDYLDNIVASNVLPEMVMQTDRYLLECDPGVLCRLGRFSLLGESGGAELFASDIAAQEDITTDSMFSYENGIYDFELHDLPIVGANAHIVIPQLAPIPANAVYRKFQNDEWSTFVEDANNLLHSAMGEPGFCPPPEDDEWQAGLIEGYYCVQLTIEDGGPNDADGEANAVIEDPGAVATAAPPVSISITSQVKGGGATAWGLLCGLIGLLLLKIKPFRKALMAGVLFLMCLSNTQAGEMDSPSSTKWYLEFAGYQASGSHTGNDLVNGVANEGINIVLDAYDVGRTAYQVQLGYQYSDAMAIELGYMDLGSATVNFSTAESDTNALSRALSKHYPISSTGWVLANRFDFYAYKKIDVSAEAGIYIWDSKIELSGLNITPDIGGGTDLLLGVNVNYRVTKRYIAGVKWQRIFFDQQEVDLFGAELRIIF